MLESIIKIAIVVLIVAGIICIFPQVESWLTSAVEWMLQSKWGLITIISCIFLAIID